MVADGNGNGYLQGHVYGSNLIRVDCSCHGSNGNPIPFILDTDSSDEIVHSVQEFIDVPVLQVI